MARRPRTSPTLSLFPFLSVLACIIGTLALLIAALVLIEFDSEDKSPTEQLASLERRIGQHQEELLTLAASLEEAASLPGAIAEIESETRELDQVLHEYVRPDDIRRQEELLLHMRQEVIDETKNRDGLLAELELRRQASHEQAVVVTPGGSGTSDTPAFVECTSSGLIFYDGPNESQMISRVADNTTVRQSLRAARASNKIVIFLIRPSGIANYDTASGVADKLAIRHGKLPVPGEGDIDLSHFFR